MLAVSMRADAAAPRIATGCGRDHRRAACAPDLDDRHSRLIEDAVFVTHTSRLRNARRLVCGCVNSDHADVLRFLALLARGHVELDALALTEALVAVALDVGVMDEDVITLLARDEAESLFCIEKLHSALCHDYSFLGAVGQPVRPARYTTRYSNPGIVIRCSWIRHDVGVARHCRCVV